MTPAVQELSKRNVPFTILEYDHDSSSESYGLEAAEKLNQPAHKVFKTLVVETNEGNLAVAIIPVNRELSLKAMAAGLKVKKVKMAKPDKVEQTTGYVLGGVSPIGQKRQLPTLLDQSAMDLESILISGGKRGLDLELSPTDLCEVTDADYEPLGINK